MQNTHHISEPEAVAASWETEVYLSIVPVLAVAFIIDCSNQEVSTVFSFPNNSEQLTQRSVQGRLIVRGISGRDVQRLGFSGQRAGGGAVKPGAMEVFDAGDADCRVRFNQSIIMSDQSERERYEVCSSTHLLQYAEHGMRAAC